MLGPLPIPRQLPRKFGHRFTDERRHGITRSAFALIIKIRNTHACHKGVDIDIGLLEGDAASLVAVLPGFGRTGFCQLSERSGLYSFSVDPHSGTDG